MRLRPIISFYNGRSPVNLAPSLALDVIGEAISDSPYLTEVTVNETLSRRSFPRRTQHERTFKFSMPKISFNGGLLLTYDILKGEIWMDEVCSGCDAVLSEWIMPPVVKECLNCGASERELLGVNTPQLSGLERYLFWGGLAVVIALIMGAAIYTAIANGPKISGKYIEPQAMTKDHGLVYKAEDTGTPTVFIDGELLSDSNKLQEELTKILEKK